MEVKNESLTGEETPLAGVDSESPHMVNREWTWNCDQNGYEGVHLHEGQFYGLSIATIRQKAVRRAARALKIS